MRRRFMPRTDSVINILILYTMSTGAFNISAHVGRLFITIHAHQDSSRRKWRRHEARLIISLTLSYATELSPSPPSYL